MGYELDAIAAVVIGGTSLFGGRGSLVGTLIGALIVGDNQSLCRLLSSLEIDVEDREIGDYLTSFLTV